MDNNGYNNLDNNPKKNNESMSNVRKKSLDWTVIATIVSIFVFVPAVIIFFSASFKTGSGIFGGFYPFIYRCLAFLSLALLIVSLFIIWGIKLVKHFRKKKNPNLYAYENHRDYTLNNIGNTINNKKPVSKTIYNKKPIGKIGKTIIILITILMIIISLLNSIKLLGEIDINKILGVFSGDNAAIVLYGIVVSLLLFLFIMYCIWKEHICDFIFKKKSNSSSVVSDLSLNNTFQNNIEYGISNGNVRVTDYSEKKQLSIKQKALLNKLKTVLIVLSIVWIIIYILFHFSIIEFDGDAYELFIDFEICMKEMNILVSLLIAIGIPCNIYGLILLLMYF